MQSVQNSRTPVSVRVAQWLMCMLSVLLLALSPTSPTFADPTSPNSGGFYVLHTNDQLMITVLGHDDYTKSVTILPDGTFDYPIVGSVPAAGLTVKQLAHFLENGLGSELDSPEVTITVTTYAAPIVNVVGVVNKAGAYTYVHDWRVIDAIAAAQGLSSPPDSVTVTLVRVGSDPVHIDGSKLMSGDDPTQDPAVLPGDTLLVEQRNVNEVSVQVSGEVKNPGAYPVPAAGESPLAAILSAGGANDDAALSQVELSHNGQVSTINLGKTNSTLVEQESLPSVMPGDVLLVPKIANLVTVIGAVNIPSQYYIPENTTLSVSGALSLAKGNLPDADLAKISVLRMVNNTPKIIKVNLVDEFKSGNSMGDPQVEPGDMIYVPMKKASGSDMPFLYALGPLAALVTRF